jgi:hypothetical protein
MRPGEAASVLRHCMIVMRASLKCLETEKTLHEVSHCRDVTPKLDAGSSYKKIGGRLIEG